MYASGLVPEGIVSAQPLFAPGRRFISAVLVPVGRARQAKEHQVCALLCQKFTRLTIGGGVGALVVKGQALRLPETMKDFRERLSKLACLFVEGERVISD